MDLDGVQDLEDETGESQELVEAEDEEVPLAKTSLVEDVKHCILHFLEWILAAVLAGYYVGSTKKQEKKIAELRKDIDDKR